MNVRLTQEQKIRILNSDDVYKVMQQVLLRENKIRRNQEHFWVVGLDNANKILFIELVSLGAVNRVMVNPPEIFRMAIYKMAVKMILVHNHPSGETEPSQADLDLTDRMMKTGELINIEVVDHLVISEHKYYSFANAGVMSQLKKNGKYEILDKEKAETRKWQAEFEKEQAVKDSNLMIAKKMKNDGIDIDTIKKYTGLTKWDIRKL
ncbi:JAB domain-containing protein [Sinomicrobium weinanense]|uniref:JAB domain-containing protein n=1 Tax=Sinomicrobium weinanense TaxID=2842200 RepID=A0A926Q5K8_9FLAO|nr:JAB domain-containing protein [Sinomicrobium weinanense]MBC9798085.1 JAB domain-containing protein [Sinomicrobium weinanense]MBU3122553.1 JAB domain-containing protein [Sinomicrobium weinanense]